MNAAPAAEPAPATVDEILPMSAFDVECEQTLLAEIPVVPGQGSDRTLPAHSPYDLQLALEDILQGRGCFVNHGRSKRRSSLGAYLTCLDYRAFEAAMKIIGVDRFRYHDWRRIVGGYRRQNYLSPTFGLLAAVLARAVSLPDPLRRDDATDAFYDAPAAETPVFGGN